MYLKKIKDKAVGTTLVGTIILSNVGGIYADTPTTDDGSKIKSVATPRFLGTDIVNIPDTMLLSAINTSLGRGASEPVTVDDLATVTTLTVPSSVVDLNGLEYAVNLGSLDLTDCNRVVSFTPLSGLTNIKSLNLCNAGVTDTDLPTIGGLTSLTTLDLSTTLEITANGITDISPLSGLMGLTKLNLGQNNISNLSALSGLTKLTELNLVDNKVSDVSYLKDLVDLTSLNLEHNDIGDISTLGGLTKLTNFYVGENNISNISVVANMPLLENFLCDDTKISDITPVSNLVNLKTLDLSYNNIENITPLTKLTNLTYLCLNYNKISDISVTNKLTKLTSLYLYHNKIQDTTPISGLTLLEELLLCDNYITDVTGIKDLKNLKYFDITFNYIDVSSGSPNRLMLDAMNGSDLSDYINQFAISYGDANIGIKKGISYTPNIRILQTFDGTTYYDYREFPMEDIDCVIGDSSIVTYANNHLNGLKEGSTTVTYKVKGVVGSKFTSALKTVTVNPLVLSPTISASGTTVTLKDNGVVTSYASKINEDFTIPSALKFSFSNNKWVVRNIVDKMANIHDMMSPEIKDNESTTNTFKVTAHKGDLLKVGVSVYSEEGKDFGSVYLNGVKVKNYSGVVDTELPLILEDGENTITFKYEKNSANSVNMDRMFIRGIELSECVIANSDSMEYSVNDSTWRTYSGSFKAEGGTSSKINIKVRAKKGTTYSDISSKDITSSLPVINAVDKTMNLKSTFNPLTGVTARDTEDGDITKNITVISNNVNTTKEGTYTVTYSVKDLDNNTVQKTINVTVKSNLPVITAVDKTITLNSTFNPLTGVTASDLEDGDITKNITVVSNKVDTTKEGTYTVTYNVKDSGNNTVQKTINVTVKGNFTQLVGTDRNDTAVKVSKEGWVTSDKVILINGSGNHYIDGLTASPLASILNAPVLLSDTSLPTLTKGELVRLKAKEVVLVGGTSSLPDSVVNQIKVAVPGVKITRLAGSDRYKTSLSVAKYIDTIQDVAKVYVTSGVGGVDALSIAPVAGRDKSPIILTAKDKVDTNVFNFLKEESIQNSYFIGGKAVLSDGVKDAIDAVIAGDMSANRISGTDRKETNAKVIDKFYSASSLTNVIVTKDQTLVDALVVGSFATKNNAPIVVAQNSLSDAQINVLTKKSAIKIYQVGGGIKDTVINRVKSLLLK